MFGEFVSDSVANESRSVSSAALARAGRRGFTRALALVLLAASLGASLGACTDLNLFHKDEVAPDEPADRLYNEGLYLLNEKKVVELDEERKASMVSNLLVVLCSDRDAQPIVNAGTLYQ